MENRISMTFQQQFRLCMVIMIVNIVLAHLTKIAWFHNLSWLIWGILFFMNPVWPESWLDAWPERRRKGVRIASLVMVVIGLITRFGI